MTKKVLLSIVGMVLVAAVLRAFPAPEGQRATNSYLAPRLADSTSHAETDGSMQQPSLQRRNSRYQLTDGDVLELDFPFSPSFNQTATVLPDGYVSLLGVGSLHVEGQTVPELKQSLQQVYAKILHNPVITVVLKDFQKPYFIVGGQVQHPGKFNLRGDTTVMQAVEIAGGFNDSAKHSQILLFRRVSNDWVEVKKLNLKDMLRGKDLSEDVHLRPGDMLFVPKSEVSKIKQFIPSTGMGMYFNPAQY